MFTELFRINGINLTIKEVKKALSNEFGEDFANDFIDAGNEDIAMKVIDNSFIEEECNQTILFAEEF